MRSVACSMCRARCFHFRREDIDSLPEDLRAEFRNHRVPEDQIHLLHPKSLLQELLSANEMEQSDRLAEFRQQINVAVFAGIVARRGTEQLQRFDVETLTKLGLHAAQSF